MTRVVLDTNVVVSGALKATGNEASVLRLVAEGSLALGVTPAILAEYEDVLLRPSFRLNPVNVRRLLAALRASALMVKPVVVVRASPHEADNRFLECVEAVAAEFLVTGNRRHFPAQWKGTRIVNARELLAAVQQKS